MGSPHVINCTVSTVSGLNSTLVIFSWRGPGGGAIMNNNRMIINPTTTSSNNFTSSNYYTSNLQFTYLMEGDEGNYTCNITIDDASGSQSVKLQSLTSK